MKKKETFKNQDSTGFHKFFYVIYFVSLLKITCKNCIIEKLEQSLKSDKTQALISWGGSRDGWGGTVEPPKRKETTF